MSTYLDQAIPPGLHVKMDLSTGGKWAKLMDNDKSNALANVVMKNEDISTSEEYDSEKK